MNIAELPTSSDSMPEVSRSHLSSNNHQNPVSHDTTMNTAVSSQALPQDNASQLRSATRPLPLGVANKCIPDECPAAFVVQELSAPWPWLQPATYRRAAAHVHSQVRRIVALIGIL